MRIKNMIKKFFSLILMICFLNTFFCPFAFAADVILEKGTKVRLKLLDKVSSGLNQEGDEVNLTVTDDVKLGDTVIIKEGTPAKAIINELSPKGKIGKAGRLVLAVDVTRAVNGKSVPLSALITKKGEDKFVLSVVLSLLVPPIGLFALLMSGENAQFPPGYQIIAKVDDDVILTLEDNIKI
jgi:hypothetical protein